MTRKCFLLPSVLFLLGWPLSNKAASYYVNNSGSPTCSDTSGQLGTLAAPFCTISYGIGRMSGGDTLNVRTGIYAETLYISGPSGTSSAHTVIQAYPGDTPTIQGPNTSNGRVKLSGVSYVDFIGFGVTNFNQGIFIEGSSSHVTVKNCTVYGIGQEGIHVHDNSSYIMLQGNAVHDTGVCCYNGEGFYIGTGDSGPADNTNNVTIIGNTAYNTTDEGIELKSGTHDCIVDGNRFHNNNSNNNGYGGASIEVDAAVSGVQNWPQNPNHIIRNNIVYSAGPGTGPSNINSGIHCATGCTAYNNVIYGINFLGYGLFTDNPASDSYSRNFYHNTVDVIGARAFVNNGGSADVRNNIGPTSGNNLATNNAYYVNEPAADYHLATNSPPVNAGVDLTSIVPTDIEGFSRLVCPPPDLGAYEYHCSRPSPPTNLAVVVQ